MEDWIAEDNVSDRCQKVDLLGLAETSPEGIKEYLLKVHMAEPKEKCLGSHLSHSSEMWDKVT